MEFYTVVTDAGLQALSDATANGEAFTIVKAVIGDGNGQKITPNKGMVTLVNQVYECLLSGKKRARKDPNTVLFTIAVPANVGGFTMREIGLLDSNDNLVIVGSIPALEKTVEVSGSVADTTYVLPVKFKNADQVTIVVDGLALATKQDVTDHDEDPEAHRRATEEVHGFTQYATEEEHKAKIVKNRACTPCGVWALISFVMSNAYTSASTIKIATSHAVNAVYKILVAHKEADDPHGIIAKVKALLSSSVSNASSTTIATPLAVKTVNDHLNTHKGANDPHGIVAKVKALLTSSVTSTSTTTFANPKAVKTVNDSLNTHKGANDPHGIVAKIRALMTSSTTSDSPNTIATSNAVKLVYDALKKHMASGDPHGVVVKVKALLTSSVTSASTTTFATPKAVKTVWDALDTHNTSWESHQQAAEGTHGFARYATKTEHIQKTSKVRACTPFGVWELIKSLLSSSVTNASSSSIATPLAVKTVHDRLNVHKSASDPHGIVAKVKALLSSSITSTSTTTFATPKAVKLVRDLVVGHTNNTVVHIPSGGSTGDVLLKNGSSVKWGRFLFVPIGHIDLSPFRPDALPPSFYMCNGEGLLKTSAAGKTLRAMPSTYKSDWGITEDSIHIFLPNVFSGSDGYFYRAVNGTTRRVGSKQGDAIREIIGHISSYDHVFNAANGAFELFGGSSGAATGPSGKAYAGVNFKASNNVPTSHENRSKNIGMTPVIYLPPL